MSFAKYWVDPEGKIYPVDSSHEEWAQAHNTDLEILLEKGWVRVQQVIPCYLFIDYYAINKEQKETLRPFFKEEYDTILIETNGHCDWYSDSESAYSSL